MNERLRAQRERMDLTQEQLARAAGVTVATVARAEAGRHEPSRRTLRRLATALSCEIDDIVPAVDSAA